MGSKNKLVCGFGVNDSDYQLHRFERIGGKYKRIWICPFYQAWRDLLTRAYSPGFHARRPTYKGCSVSEKWRLFSEFKAWMESQDWEGCSLDKDLIFPGNKVYGPETCVFVSKSLNNFLGECGRSRGKYKIGASWHRRTESFRSDCMNPFTGHQESLGHFTSEDAAHESWISRKHQHACAYAEMHSDPMISLALRSRYSPYLMRI
jgi:hypothetical protein